jgi:X-linked retinitis pigmentosa GTPase regulator
MTDNAMTTEVESATEEGELIDLEVQEEPTEDVSELTEEQPEEVAEETESEEVEAKEEPEEELQNYSENVQKRINKLTKKLREAERASESAYSYAAEKDKELKILRQKSTLEAQEIQANAALADALQSGDYEKAAKAQRIIADIAVQQNNVQQSKQNLQNVVEPEQTTPAPIPKPEPKAEAWAENNTWFGEDETMTFAAFKINRELVESGKDPSSDSFYEEIDKQMREEFPHKFDVQETDVKKPQQKVASAVRADSAPRGKRQIRLSPSEVIMAKRLNVPLKEYAKYVKRG